jgi:2-polyprenyl-3-methyl-5-hydroxy-6-metoxy-1,4-benzoquinol methylase
LTPIGAARVSQVPSEVQLEHAPCPMGCRPGDTPVLTGRDRLHDLPGEFSVVRCHSCGLMRTDPRPTAATIGFYYPEEYAPYRVPFAIPPRARNKPMIWRRRARKTLRRWLGKADPRALPISPPGRLFELGAANGKYLARAVSLGWQANGIEMSAKAIELGRQLGLDIEVGTIESASAPEEPYEVVVGWMVFEHLHQPLEIFRKLCEFVRPGGWLVFSIPDASAAEFQIFGHRWYALHLPCHLTHFTSRSVKAMLADAGWSVKKIIWHPNPNNLLQSLRYLALDHGYRRLADWLAEVIAERKARRFRARLGQILSILRQSGRITVWAQRHPS